MNVILEGLNKEQSEAVQHNKGPLLILAGAGSGKTKVLTHRIAYLIHECKVNPWNILALTFTNKAAGEMRERVDKIVGYGAEKIWVSTFHSTCVRILRRYIDALGYDSSFTIYDSDDQKTLMRDICKYLKIDTKKINERSILSVISKAKDELVNSTAFAAKATGDFNQERYAMAYTEYQKRLKQNNALDFDDLIFKTVELFEQRPDILNGYQNRFKYIMVDEYQDTNTAQFQLIRFMASTINEYGETEHNLCVVGDDDQSIYKFRGANIHNILNFEGQYPLAKVIKLEQNYRSTKTILNAANQVIQNNSQRKDKALWTDNEEGSPIIFTAFDNEHEESESIVNDIYHGVHEESLDYSDFSILYRTNAQSRIFEEKLVRKNIPYKIVGAVNFYARKEIKDLLAYLKTINNGADDIAIKRIINIPKRGIGLTTIDRISQYALENEISFYNALRHASSIPGIGRGLGKIEAFVSFIEILKGKSAQIEYSIEDLINEIIETTGYVAELETEDTPQAQGRIENIEELKNKIISFENDALEPPTLSAFLEEVALVADIDNLENNTDVVVLMTLHSAKGLEFPYVYLCGMEEGLFPSYMTIHSEDPLEIEEERRLCYVGITRAKIKLSISYANMRMVHGETRFNQPSRFIFEIPRYLMTDSTQIKKPVFPSFSSHSGEMKSFHGASSLVSKSVVKKTEPQKGRDMFAENPLIQKGFTPKTKNTEPPSYSSGDTVIHDRFGQGTVLEIKPIPNDYEVTICFDKSGQKKIRTSFVKLKKL